jgi:VanZ family protein
MPIRTWRSSVILLALVCYWSALFVATHMPAQMVLLPGGLSDKMPHVVAFAVLAILFAAAWRVTAGPLGWRQLCTVWALIVLYGAVDEVTQIPVGRNANLSDWLADAAGATLGLAIFQIWNVSVARVSDS